MKIDEKRGKMRETKGKEGYSGTIGGKEGNWVKFGEKREIEGKEKRRD